MLEIERRFLVTDPPLLDARDSVAIWQAYLSVTEQSSIRIRKVNSKEHRLSIKWLPEPDTILVRNEVDIMLTEADFAQLQAAAICQPVIKRRYMIPNEGVDIELDVFSGHLAGLIVAEIEFSSVDSAASFDPLPWFGAEITEDYRFLNSSLAQWGKPAMGITNIPDQRPEQ